MLPALRASRRRRNAFSTPCWPTTAKRYKYRALSSSEMPSRLTLQRRPSALNLWHWAAAAGLIIALGLALLLELKEPRRPCIEDVQRTLTCPHMTSVPATSAAAPAAPTPAMALRRVFAEPGGTLCGSDPERPARHWSGTAKARRRALCLWCPQECRAKAPNRLHRTSPTITRCLEVCRFSSMQIPRERA